MYKNLNYIYNKLQQRNNNYIQLINELKPMSLKVYNASSAMSN